MGPLPPISTRHHANNLLARGEHERNNRNELEDDLEPDHNVVNQDGDDDHDDDDDSDDNSDHNSDNNNDDDHFGLRPASQDDEDLVPGTARAHEDSDPYNADPSMPILRQSPRKRKEKY